MGLKRRHVVSQGRGRAIAENLKFFILKDDNGKLWVEMIFVTSLETVVTVDVAGTEHMITVHRTKGGV